MVFRRKEVRITIFEYRVIILLRKKILLAVSHLLLHQSRLKAAEGLLRKFVSLISPIHIL